MKLSKLFFGVAAAAMFAACSSDDIVAEQPQAQWNEDGTGYLALSIGMPDAKISRASSNDDFHDGLASEFNVEDAILVLFQGATEASAEVVSAYKIGDTTFGEVGGPADNITSDKLIVQKILAPTGVGKIYALVILNNNGYYSVSGTNLTVNGNNFMGKTIADFQKEVVNGLDLQAPQFTNHGFLMTNAPLSTKPGEDVDPAGAEIQVLAPVDETAIMGSAVDARSKVAAYVYVERAVAKVTMQSNTGSTTASGQFASFDWELNEWVVDNTNQSSYLVRNTAGYTDATSPWLSMASRGAVAANKYRFVGFTPVTHTGSTLGASHTAALYRTYFGTDPNYATDAVLTTSTTSRFAGTANFGDANPQYCAENTFDVEHQNWENTTRVLVKATLTPTSGSLYYGRPGDDSFLNAEGLKVLAYNYVLDQLKGEANYAAVSGSVNYAAATVTDNTGTVTVKLNGLTGDAGLVATYATAGITVTPENLGLRYYPGGVNYYQTRIRHFDDTQTPWNDWESLAGMAKVPAAGNTTAIYPANNTETFRLNDYLGRYGVLRNNWYDISVTAVKKLGYPTPDHLNLDTPTDPDYPMIPETPDDEIEAWISLDVNILSWAKRTQNHEF